MTPAHAHTQVINILKMATTGRTSIKSSLVSPIMSRRNLGTMPLSSSSTRPKSSKGKRLAASLDASMARKSLDVSNWGTEKVESEYIKNLQQQVYFLELETNYLQEQLKKATVIPPRVTEEADRMMRKLKALQADVDSRSQEVARKESETMTAIRERDNAVRKLRDQEDSFAVEKKELVNEIVRIKKQLDRQQLDSSRKEVSLTEIRQEADEGLNALQDAENKIHIYRREIDGKTEEYNRLRVQYEEKRAECLKLQTEYQELEDRFFKSGIKSRDEVGKVLREEMRLLRYDCRQKELAAQQDRSLRNKISDDCAALVKENAALSSQVLELQKELDAERQFQDDKESRRHANIQELVTAKENEKVLTRELEHLRDQFRIEKQKHKDAMDKLLQGERGLNKAKLRGTKLQCEVDELENLNTSQSEENMQLRRVKMTLTDHVADLQAKVRERDEEVQAMTVELNEYKDYVTLMESRMKMQHNVDSIKWEEFEKMADSLKEFSKNMSPLRQSRTVDFDS